MPTLAQVRRGLYDTLNDNLSDVTVYQFVPEQLTLPALVIEPASGQVTTMGRGSGEFNFTVSAFVSRTTDAQQLLDELIDFQGTKSVIAVIHDNSDLDGAVTNRQASCSSWSGYGTVEVGGVPTYITASLEVRVITEGTS